MLHITKFRLCFALGCLGFISPIAAEDAKISLDSDFDAIEVSHGARVLIHHGQEFSVSLEGDPKDLTTYDVMVRGGTLHISPYQKALKRALFHVTLPTFHTVEVRGSGRLECVDSFELENLDVEISGSGTIRLRGACEKQRVEISGSGRYEGYDMRSIQASVDISGSGLAQVYAEKELATTVTGSGRIQYKGNAKVRKEHRFWRSKVEKMES